MKNPDEASKNESSNSNRTGDSPSFIFGINRIASDKKNWLRSIPHHIRKFISKPNQRHPKKLISLSGSSGGSASTACCGGCSIQNKLEPTYANENYTATDEFNSYSMIEYLDNDEEVAMICACSQMSTHGWFWGPISKHTAQQRLHGTPNGSFLVRNSQINSNNFTISFRTAGKTLHYRIEFLDGFWQTFSTKHRSVVDLIDDAMKKSKENVFCYVKQSSQLIPPFPVRLTNPISRFGDVSSLTSMCRQVIKKNVDATQMDLLPLPNKLISYCKEIYVDPFGLLKLNESIYCYASEWETLKVMQT